VGTGKEIRKKNRINSNPDKPGKESRKSRGRGEGAKLEVVINSARFRVVLAEVFKRGEKDRRGGIQGKKISISSGSA